MPFMGYQGLGMGLPTSSNNHQQQQMAAAAAAFDKNAAMNPSENVQKKVKVLINKT